MISFDTVSKILKQKTPFVFIDRVLELEPNKKIVALKNISGCEMFSSLHFPQNAIYPGVLLIETVAQAAAVLFHVSISHAEDEPRNFVVLGGIQQFQFIKSVGPGDCLIIQVTPIKIIGNMAIVKAEIRVEDKIIAKGQLSFGVVKSDTAQ